MNKLNVCNLHDQDHMIYREIDPAISLNDSALEVFIDYRKQPPLVVNSQSSAVEVQHLLRLTTQPVVVIDRTGNFVGILTSYELNDHEIIKRTSLGYLRGELKVIDFALTKDFLKGFHYQDLAKASVKDAVITLRENGQRICLVTDHKTHEILGIICQSQIETRLRRSVYLDGKTDSEKITTTIYNKVHPLQKLQTVM